MAEAQLVLEGVSKVFGPKPEAALKRLETSGRLRPDETLGVHNVSLDVRKGETFVLMGRSGSGKSTLLRLVNGLLRPTAGRVRAGGADLATLSPRALVRLRRAFFCGMVFQSFALLPFRTALGNAAFGLELQGVGRRERLERAQATLELVGLGDRGHVFPSELSGGMQQRLGLARALAAAGDVLLLDEPFSALDPITRHDLQAELERLRRRLGKTVVLVTHDLDEAFRLGDRVALLSAGRVQQVGTPADLATRPANRYVAAFVAGFDKTGFLTARHVMRPTGPAPETVTETATETVTAPHPGGARGRVVGPDTPLSELVRLAAQDPAALPVVDGGRVVGVVTAQHLLAALAEGRT